MYILSKFLHSYYIQVKSTVAYVEKGMAGFHEYAKQPDTAFKMCVHHKLCTMHVEMLHVARNEATVHCVLLNQWARVVSKPSSSIRH